MKFKRISLIFFTALSAALFTAGCTSNGPSSSGFFSPYRVDIPQGNYVTKEMVDLVQQGMSQQQVKFSLGAPLLTPIFDADRWDYVFRYQYANGSSELRRVVIRFKDSKVAAIESDQLPLKEDNSDPALPGSKVVKSKSLFGSDAPTQAPNPATPKVGS